MGAKTKVPVKVETTTITRTVVAGKWIFVQKGSSNS